MGERYLLLTVAGASILDARGFEPFDNIKAVTLLWATCTWAIITLHCINDQFARNLKVDVVDAPFKLLKTLDATLVAFDGVAEVISLKLKHSRRKQLAT